MTTVTLSLSKGDSNEKRGLRTRGYNFYCRQARELRRRGFFDRFFFGRLREQAFDFLYIFVAAARKADQNQRVFLTFFLLVFDIVLRCSESVSRFERGDNSFFLRKLLKRFECLLVFHSDILRAPLLQEVGMLGAYTGVIEPG